MMQKLDQSPGLIRLLNRTSNVFARRRGLPVMIGIVLIAISLILAVVNLNGDSQLLSLLQIVSHHVGVILALVGLLLVQPLGN
ncbi:hypothetical protein VZO05_05715 [Aggregatilineales bacterium SYSU G02658]